MDCVLLAGGRPAPDDPLYPFTQGAPKALLKIAGRPLVDYTLDALTCARSVDRIVVVGLEEDAISPRGDAVQFLPDQGGLIANGLAGLALIRQSQPETRHVLFASADIPAATGSMIDDVLATYRPFDRSAYYFMVEKRAMETTYPGANRTYIRLKGLQVAGADITVADARLADGNSQLFKDIAAGRKQAWKLARIAGLSTILALLFRHLTLEGIERRASKVLGSPVSVTLIDHPALAMDVDKPDQLSLLRAVLE